MTWRDFSGMSDLKKPIPAILTDKIDIPEKLNCSKIALHTCFIRKAYKEQFWPLVKFLEKIRNRLVIFQKIKEQKQQNILKIPNSFI